MLERKPAAGLYKWMEAMSELPLAAEFPKSDYDQWRKRAERGLAATESFAENLVSKTLDGIAIEPVYPRAPNAPVIAGAGRQNGCWGVIQRIDHPAPAHANALALADLAGGAGGLALIFAGAPSARGFGLQIADQADFECALKDVLLEAIAVRLEAGGHSLGIAAHLIALVESRGLDLAQLDISLGLDPISTFAARGQFAADYGKVAARLGDVAAALYARGFAGRIAVADGRAWHGAGASEAQELACVLGLAVQYLRDFEAAGLPLAWSAQRIGAVLAVDAGQFANIAKIRALRLLWARVLEASGLDPAPLHIHAETAWAMMTKRGVYVNMLRTACAAFSAALGGADTVCVLPFTSALGLPDEFARRMARNSQLIMAQEAHIGRVADPGAGSGLIEALSQALAEAAWKLFRDFGGNGGIVDAITSQRLQKQIAKSRKAREDQFAAGMAHPAGKAIFAQREDIPVNVLEFKQIAPEPLSPPADLPPPGDGAQFDAMIALAGQGASPSALMGKPAGKPLKLEPLPANRLAEPYEGKGA